MLNVKCKIMHMLKLFVATAGSRINTQVVALSCGLFLTCGENVQLKLTSIYSTHLCRTIYKNELGNWLVLH